MTGIADSLHPRSHEHGSRTRHTPLMLPLAAMGLLGLGALGLITYLLWPRWPAAVSLNAPAIPITIGGAAFNVPPAAVRIAMQRRPGAHERVDLVFLWPSLEPPDAAARPAMPAGALPAPLPIIERMFVTITVAGSVLPPAERVKIIYPRYAVIEPAPGPDGLAVLAFRDGTPYQGEDLIYDTADGGFVVRCTRNGAGVTPGICLHDRRIEGADLVVRFPRDWLGNWRGVATGIERLVAKLRPPR